MSSEAKIYETLCAQIGSSEVPIPTIDAISKFVINNVTLIIKKFTTLYTIDELLINVFSNKVYLRLKINPTKDDPFYNGNKCIHVTCYDNNYFGVDFKNTMSYKYILYKDLNYFWKLVHCVFYIAKFRASYIKPNS